VANNDHRQTVKLRKAAHDCRVFSKPLVTMKLDEVFKQTLDEI
jgi:hypothetical protein